MTKDKRSTINVQGAPINILSHREEDFISLTDMSKKFGDDALIYSWMRNRNTLEFLGLWEQMHNPDFKGGEFETFKKQARLNSFHLTPRKWIATKRTADAAQRDRHSPAPVAYRTRRVQGFGWRK